MAIELFCSNWAKFFYHNWILIRRYALQPYKERFVLGSLVQVADLTTLEDFQKNWKYHNPLTPEQLPFAGKKIRVAKVGFYHGGDPLYVLDGVPGVWHEACLVET